MFFLPTIIATLIAAGSALADGWTTYIGKYHRVGVVEGNSNMVAQWISDAPWRLFTIEPIAILLCGVFFSLYPYWQSLLGYSGEYMAISKFGPCVLAAGVTALHTPAAIENYLINSKLPVK